MPTVYDVISHDSNCRTITSMPIQTNVLEPRFQNYSDEKLNMYSPFPVGIGGRRLSAGVSH